jgi:ribosomal-protein-alanine N-acetyltransferase
MMPVIRKATSDDLERMCDLERRCFERKRFSEDHMMWLLENPDATSYVYQNEGGAVASMILMKMGRISKVISLGVVPGHRRRGIATELLTLGEDRMREQGVASMHLEVGVTNEAAIRLYESLGYETLREMSEYYSWGEDAFAMKKPI